MKIICDVYGGFSLESENAQDSLFIARFCKNIISQKSGDKKVLDRYIRIDLEDGFVDEENNSEECLVDTAIEDGEEWCEIKRLRIDSLGWR